MTVEVLESFIVQKQPSTALMYIIHCHVSLYIHLNYMIQEDSCVVFFFFYDYMNTLLLNFHFHSRTSTTD